MLPSLGLVTMASLSAAASRLSLINIRALRRPSHASLQGFSGFELVSPQTRSLAGRASAPGATAASTTGSAAIGGYFDSKRAAKERRRALFEASAERSRKVQQRRTGRPKDQKKVEFRDWFVRKRVNEEYMERKARQAGLAWRHQVSVILERQPVVLPDLESWERDYLDMEAHLAQFGKLYPKEFMQDSDDSSLAAMTLDELLKSLPKDFTPAPRETEADAIGDLKTTNRKLKSSIYLALNENGTWQFPTVELTDEDTIVDGAVRAMATKVGGEIEYWCPSNSPFAVEMKADDKGDGAFYGTKTFFVKTQYDEGDISKASLSADDFAWLDRDEMAERVRESHGDDRFYSYIL